MTHSEFWKVMERVFPDGRARSLAQDVVLIDVGLMTADEALDAGVAPVDVWKAIVSAMDLPETYEYLHMVDEKPKK